MTQYSRDYVYPSKLRNLFKKKSKQSKFWKRRYQKRFRQKTKPKTRKK